ncbi:MAG: recombinase family protein [Terriglobales bacterium]
MSITRFLVKYDNVVNTQNDKNNDGRQRANSMRMSTDQQQYSLLNQASAIAKYAGRNNFVVVKTYEDAGRSGLVLRERPGLQSLLKDVVAHDLPYKAILVYDVSRWGRLDEPEFSWQRLTVEVKMMTTAATRFL